MGGWRKSVTDDFSLRLAAFDWLKAHEAAYQGVFPFAVLQRGFDFNGERISLASMQGIFKPKSLRIPISIRTAVGGPYPDGIDENNRISYSYRGKDLQHPENVGLREAMKQRIPLIYFKAVTEGRYAATWPVYIVGDEPANLMFTAVADDPMVLQNQNLITSEAAPIRRAYVMQTVQRRVHQAAFRERVLDAYDTHCSLCRLKHRELLDAAHIIPDAEERGEPKVSNGLSMCKLHHAAYDYKIVGISPDYVVHIRKDVLEEIDGPMLKHGLQEMAGAKLFLPTSNRHRPDREALENRFNAFNS